MSSEQEQIAEIVLDDLENVGRMAHLNMNDDLQMVICKTMEYLESWNHAESKHPGAHELIERVQEQNHKFLEAMDISVRVAKNGHIISGDMVVLCDALNSEHHSSTEIHDFIGEMKEMADESLHQAKRACKRFRHVRQALMQITNDIPVAVAEIQDEHRMILDKNTRADQRVDRIKQVRSCATAAAAVVGAIALIACPPAFIALPIALPLITLVAEYYERKNTKKIARRDTQARNCEEAIKFLHDAALQIAKAITRVESFVGYWTEITSLLDVISTQVSELRRTKALRLRSIAIKSSWKKLGESYFVYMSKMEILKNLCVPPSTLTGSNASSSGSINEVSTTTPRPSNRLHKTPLVAQDTNPRPRPVAKQSKTDPLLLFLTQEIQRRDGV